MAFRDRKEAGAKLAEALAEYRGAADAIVVALPRGGVEVGAEIARALRLPLDIVVPRKIANPEEPEYALGALTEDGLPVWGSGGEPRGRWVSSVIQAERKESLRRLRRYRRGRGERSFHHKTVIVVDDGVATGLTMEAAIRTIRDMGAQTIILAVPHGAWDSLDRLRSQVDRLISLEAPLFYGSVGSFYQDFPQVSDEEVIALMEQFV
jgi:predicted phosphoribosyltransferase